MEDYKVIKIAAESFEIPGVICEIRPYGNGHINDTYLLETTKKERYILQKINTHIFNEPEKLMDNILMVTSHLREKIEQRGMDPDRETLNVILTKEGKPFFRDAENGSYRIYKFVEGSVCYDTVENPDDFYQSGVGFGSFQSMLADFQADRLHEIIPGFHNTEARYRKFCRAVEEDRAGRASYVEREIRFVKEREVLSKKLCEKQKSGELPLRVTHNDTKLNNVLMDAQTKKALCVIDLDTVMPGLAVNDFGDSIRFGANTAAEDETDLRKVSCSLELFESYTRGFIHGCGNKLHQSEMLALLLGAQTMTFECGMRFLTDYLEGDTYFKIHRKDHNRDRCRTQFRLLEDMEEKEEQMMQIVERYL